MKHSLLFAGLITVAAAACNGTTQRAAASGTAGTGGVDGTGGIGTGATGSSVTASSGTGTTSTSGSTSGTTTTTTTGTGTASSGGSSAVTVYVTPDTSLVGQMVTAIEGATTYVHMTMYILDNAKIIAALVNRKQAGLDVRVILNQTFPAGTTDDNQTTYATLTAAGIGVVWRNGPPGATAGAYTHEKTFVIDGKQAWIGTMNLDTGSPLYNREYVAVDDEPADIAEAETIFLADYTGSANASGAPLVVSPDPPSNSRSSIVALIDAATTTLDIEAEEFSDDYGASVTAAVAAAAKRGVATRLVLAQGTPASSQTTAIATVKAAGVKVVVSGGASGTSTASNPYIHAKTIVVDCGTGAGCTRGYLGSVNFSTGSLSYNRELGLIVDNTAELAKIETAIAADFAAGTPQ